MKGQYNIYQSFTHDFIRLIRRDVGIKNERDAMVWLFDNNPELRAQLDGKILADEHYWLKSDRHVIFPQSCDILNRLMESEFSLSKSTGFNLPHDSFYLAFPKNYEIADQPAQGCMISYLDHFERKDNVHKRFSEYIKNHMGYVPDKNYLNDKILNVVYRSPDEPDRLVAFTIPESLIPDCLSARNATAYGKLIGFFPDNEYQQQLDLDELNYQYHLFQLIVRISVYAMACDEALIDGYPGIRPKHLEPKGIQYTDTTLGMPSGTREHSQGFYRSWHFRQLVNKRYYQGEHAKKPIGSRIIFVKDTMVNLNIEAETLS